MTNDKIQMTNLRTACPGEHILNDYLTGNLSEADQGQIEKHIADCPYCIFRIAEAHEVLSESNFKQVKEFFMNVKKKINLWLIGCIILFLLSFIYPRYFLQFLVGAILLGIKWIIDNKNTKMLIMIYEAWKQGGRKEADRILKSLDSRMKE